MTEGTSQGLFIVVAIVIFGIFLSLSYTLFGKTLQPQMVSLFNESIETVNVKGLDANYMVKGKITPTDESLFEFNDETQTIFNYTGEIKDIVIPYEIRGKEVKHIGDYAFNRDAMYNNSENYVNHIKVDLNSVIIPNSVETIGGWAFRIPLTAPETITKIILGNSVKSIESNAFYGNKITQLIIPDSVVNLGHSSFKHSRLTELYIPSSVKRIDQWAFETREVKLKKVVIRNKDSDITIHKEAFNGSKPIIEYKP